MYVLYAVRMLWQWVWVCVGMGMVWYAMPLGAVCVLSCVYCCQSVSQSVGQSVYLSLCFCLLGLCRYVLRTYGWMRVMEVYVRTVRLSTPVCLFDLFVCGSVCLTVFFRLSLGELAAVRGPRPSPSRATRDRGHPRAGMVGWRPGASARCAEKSPSMWGAEIRHWHWFMLLAFQCHFFYNPVVICCAFGMRCWVAMENGWGTRPFSCVMMSLCQQEMAHKISEANFQHQGEYVVRCCARLWWSLSRG